MLVYIFEKAKLSETYRLTSVLVFLRSSIILKFGYVLERMNDKKKWFKKITQ